VFVSKQGDPSRNPSISNIPNDQHWTDIPPPGSIALLQQPSGQISALLGDIVATRLAIRGVAGVIVDGRIRDLTGCGELCAKGSFAVWSKASSTVGTSLEAKPWSVDVPVEVGGRVVVRPGDFAVLDEAEKGIVVIPKDKLVELAEILPGLKEADEGVLRDVRAGFGLKEAFRRHPGHYVNAS
jgi:regulator of RNase E activity RraA